MFECITTMSTFPSNASNFRNRTLNSSTKNTNINYKINSYANESLIFCPACNIPFSTRLRINPCYHTVCGKCYEMSLQKNQSCIICYTEINDVDFIFQNDNIYICPYSFCKKVFLNLKSYNYHIYFKHEFLKEHEQDHELNWDRENDNIFSNNNEFENDDFVNYANGPEFENKSSAEFPNIDDDGNYMYDHVLDKKINPEYAKFDQPNNNNNIDTLKINNTNFNIKNNPFLTKNNTTNENTSTNVNNKMNIPFINNKVNVPDNWNFASMPFRSNFSIPSNEKYNTNNTNTKKNTEPKEEDDYDNLEDLM
ncbi:zinc finger protein, putative [Plasmodium vinckei brucechwatti]|uniref:Zinc finger protein, putative n=1 Tax=Plasmodium vinckei brucechwatti TaxID=119398 RepID=A0A6V7RXJ4_PLAVN|nr:zinc finger protein, putative [Plasmodium vinckei brucechwatti]